MFYSEMDWIGFPEKKIDPTKRHHFGGDLD